MFLKRQSHLLSHVWEPFQVFDIRFASEAQFWHSHGELLGSPFATEQPKYTQKLDCAYFPCSLAKVALQRAFFFIKQRRESRFERILLLAAVL